MANYFKHLLSLDTSTYTVAQIAKRFEPSSLLYCGHSTLYSHLVNVFDVFCCTTCPRQRHLLMLLSIKACESSRRVSLQNKSRQADCWPLFRQSVHGVYRSTHRYCLVSSAFYVDCRDSSSCRRKLQCFYCRKTLIIAQSYFVMLPIISKDVSNGRHLGF